MIRRARGEIEKVTSGEEAVVLEGDIVAPCNETHLTFTLRRSKACMKRKREVEGEQDREGEVREVSSSVKRQKLDGAANALQWSKRTAMEDEGDEKEEEKVQCKWIMTARCTSLVADI